MKFTTRIPQNWKELQDFVAEYLIVAGYTAITPHEINTVRGKVEVDVYIEAPYELVKHIICECKYWNTPVTKEKIHAFRTVVHDSGAELGIIISKNGYQSGAIEAAKYSNIRLETWDSFLNIIRDKWLDNKLWVIKTMAARVMSFADTYTYECEKLFEQESRIYQETCRNISSTTVQCVVIQKSDLIDNTSVLDKFFIPQKYNDIEQYLTELQQKLKSALDILEQLSIQPDNPNRFIATMKTFMQNIE